MTISRRARRRLPLPIIATLIVLTVAEIAIRVISPKLAPLNWWNDWEATMKVEAMDRLEDKGGASTVFIGSSMMNAAADPGLFSRVTAAGRPAFNAALNGAGTRLLDLWTLGVVIPRLHPETVIVGLSSRELNDLGIASENAYRSVRASPGGRSVARQLSITEWLLRAGDNSFLVRYRQLLRTPSQLFETPPRARSASVGPLGVLTALRVFDKATYRADRFFEDVVPRTLSRFETGGIALSALRHLIDELTAARIRVVLVEMPITQDAIDAHPRRGDDYQAFEQVLGSLASRTTNVIDGRTWFEGTAEFADPFHLNGIGRARFTRLLAGEVGAA